jgi:hypothetical protein
MMAVAYVLMRSMSLASTSIEDGGGGGGGSLDLISAHKQLSSSRPGARGVAAHTLSVGGRSDIISSLRGSSLGSVSMPCQPGLDSFVGDV